MNREKKCCKRLRFIWCIGQEKVKMEKGSGTGEQENTFTIFYLMCMTELYVTEGTLMLGIQARYPVM